MSLFQVVQIAIVDVPNPPAGTYTLFLDSADGLWKKKDSAGTVTTVGMGASLYLSNGTLAAARTVNMNSLALGFTNAAAGIAIGAATANASAILDLTSTTEGLLPPRVTTTQKNAIATPATGLIVYDTTDSVLQQYNGTSWTGVSKGSSFITLTDAATIAWNLLEGSNAQVTLTANRILGTPTNVSNGDYGTLKVIQDAVGGRTLALPATFQVVNGGASAITLTAAANAVDVICWVYDGTNFWVTFGLNFT